MNNYRYYSERKIMKIIRILSFILLLLSLSACESRTTTNGIDKTNQRISALEDQITELQQSIDILQNTLTLESAKNTAVFTSPNDKNFQLVNTDNGMLLISLDDIKEYSDGYKIIFSIGNPSTATYSDTHFRLTYGPKDKNSNEMDIKGSAMYETDIIEDLLPGYWNKIEIILSNVKKEQLNYMWVDIYPKIAKLKISPHNSN